MAQEEVNEQANEYWAICTLSMSEKHVSLRFRIEYRKRNVLTVMDLCSLPRVDGFIESLGEANTEYWQIEIEKHGRSKTTFNNQHGRL